MPKNKSLRVIVIMTLLLLIAIVITRFYYKQYNKIEDPRVVEAKYLYVKYNDYVKQNKYKQVLLVLDTIENIYLSEPHYSNSYEMGVVCINRASVYLTFALYKDSMHVADEECPVELNFSRDSLLLLSERQTMKCIGIYDLWQSKFSKASSDEIRNIVQSDFVNIKADKKMLKRYINRRVKDIELALAEMPRRLSVCYTNLGLIKRHQGQYLEAANLYKKAIELWEQNLTAKNNLNMLLNRPLEEKGLLEQIFPPEKSK